MVSPFTLFTFVIRYQSSFYLSTMLLIPDDFDYAHFTLLFNFFKFTIMGKIKDASIGALKGKVGNLVGSSWMGTDYYRIHRKHVSNPRTPKQVAQRERFKAACLLIRRLRTPIVMPVWSKVAVNMTGANFFMKRNMQAVNADATIDLSKLVISTGSLYDPLSLDLSKDESGDGSFVFDWKDDPEEYSFDGEELFNVVVFNEADSNMRPDLYLRCAARKNMLFQFIPKGKPGDKLHVFAFFRNVDNDNFTDSWHFDLTIGE